MKLIYIYLVLLFNYIKPGDYKVDINPLINEGFKVFGNYRIESGTYLYYTDSSLKIHYPARNFSNFYLIFDYYIHKTSGNDFSIKIFDKNYYGSRSKIVLKINTTSAFTINIHFKESYGKYEIYANYLTGYSNYPYLYHYYRSLSYNFSMNYCVNDEFRMFMNITDFPKGKKYYFYQSFRFKDKPAYKLFESYDSALNFNFKNFDGYLDIDDNKIMRFEKSDKKYNYLALYFKGKETYEIYNPELYELLFANLENYEQFTFNPIIPVVIFLISVILITALFYFMFQYEKKPKKQKIYEGELMKDLI